ncbi:MAG: pilin [Candidatus Parcubacteria bacterium]|nr:pilin [Candidatus Parcubacteria bacterium]
MSSFKKVKFWLILLISLGFLFSVSQVAWAQDSILPPCTSTGDCSLCDILQTAINAGKVILGIIGSLVLLMFVYGGFTWLISSGNEANIKKGKDILVNAVVGLAIIFSAYLIVTTLVAVLTKQNFDWQAKLTCTPVSFTPVTITNAVNLSAAVPKGTDQVKGESCNTTADCGGCTTPKCYCQKKATGTDGTCAEVGADGTACKNDEIKSNKNATCASQNCGSSSGKCEAGGNACKTKGECSACSDSATPGKGQFCKRITPADATKGDCADKLDTGATCNKNIATSGCLSSNYECFSGVCDSATEKCVCNKAGKDQCRNNKTCNTTSKMCE